MTSHDTRGLPRPDPGPTYISRESLSVQYADYNIKLSTIAYYNSHIKNGENY